jgi:hypothetical protein
MIKTSNFMYGVKVEAKAHLGVQPIIQRIFVFSPSPSSSIPALAPLYLKQITSSAIKNLANY